MLSMKKFIRFISLVMAAALLGGCGAPGGSNTPSEPAPTEDPFKNSFQKSDPAEDDTLYILMTAASFSYYYVEELYGMFEAAGIKAKVCDMYKGSTGLDKCYEYWKAGENCFQLRVMDENGLKVQEAVNMDYCLRAYNWDLISFQDGSASFRTTPAQQTLVRTRPYLQEMTDYVRKLLPKTKLYMQQVWAYDIGFDRFGFKMESREQQEEMHQRSRDYTLAACEEFQLSRVPSGDAWAIARQSAVVGNLCARLAENNGEGDYYHDGDIGGGQYLNACVWFETLTGQSCIGNTYRPDYALSEDLITVLQNAAHQAVENMKNGQ